MPDDPERLCAMAIEGLRDDMQTRTIDRETAVMAAKKWLDSALPGERGEALGDLVERVAEGWDWPEPHDCERYGFDEDSQECAACRSESSRLRAECVAMIQPEPDDGSTDCPF